MDKDGKLYNDFVELLNQLNASNSLSEYKTLTDQYNIQKSHIDNKYEPIRMQAEHDYSVQKNNIEAQYGQMINQAEHYVRQAEIALDLERQRDDVKKDISTGKTNAEIGLEKAKEQLGDAQDGKNDALSTLIRHHQIRVNTIEKNCKDEILKTWDKFVNQIKPILQENKSEIVNGFEEIFNTLNQMENSFEKVNKFLELVAKKIDNALAYHIVSLTDISDMINNTNMSDDLKYIENNYTELYKKNTKLYEELVESVDQLADKKDILINIGSNIKEELDLFEKYYNDINNSSKYIYNNTGIFKQLMKDKDAKLSKLENIVNNYDVLQENKDLLDKIVSIYEQMFQTLEEVQRYSILPKYNEVMARDSLDSNLKNIIKDKFNVININELNSFFDGNNYYTKDAENNYSSLISNNNTMNENIHKVKDFIKSFNDNYDVFSQKVKSESTNKVVKYLLVSGFIIAIAIASSFFYIEYQEQQRLQTVSGYGNGIQYIENPSEAVQLAAVKQNGKAIEYIKNPSEAVQLAAVKQTGYAIEYIKDPSEAVQLAAVKQSTNAVQYIKNPTKAILSEVEAKYLERVKKSWGAIQYIKDPSEAVQMAAVKQMGSSIEYIKYPSEAVQLAALKSSWGAIKYIKDPSEAVQLAAVKEYGGAIEYIKNPSEALQMAAVQNSGRAIEYIKNPSEAVQLAALKHEYAGGFEHIKNPSEVVQLAAVKLYGHALRHIKNPSEAVQLAAVKQNADAVGSIKNPSETIQWATVKHDPNAIYYIKNPSKAVKAYACPLRTITYTDQQGRWSYCK